MRMKKLACSFCRRSAADVAKLVAGPRVYICDRCAAEALRIMNDSDSTAAPPPTSWAASWRTRLHRLKKMVGRAIRRTEVLAHG